jgi:hypothetical protein
MPFQGRSAKSLQTKLTAFSKGFLREYAWLTQGCQISWQNIPKREKNTIWPVKYTEMAVKYTIWSQNKPVGRKIHMPNCRELYQMAVNFTVWPQNKPVGCKIYHMAAKLTSWP